MLRQAPGSAEGYAEGEQHEDVEPGWDGYQSYSAANFFFLICFFGFGTS